MGHVIGCTHRHLVVREGAVLVDGVDPGDDGADGLALEDPFLLAFGEKRDLVVDVFEDDEDSGLAGKLLSTVVLEQNYSRN